MSTGAPGFLSGAFSCQAAPALRLLRQFLAFGCFSGAVPQGAELPAAAGRSGRGWARRGQDGGHQAGGEAAGAGAAGGWRHRRHPRAAARRGGGGEGGGWAGREGERRPRAAAAPGCGVRRGAAAAIFPLHPFPCCELSAWLELFHETRARCCQY